MTPTTVVSGPPNSGRSPRLTSVVTPRQGEGIVPDLQGTMEANSPQSAQEQRHQPFSNVRFEDGARAHATPRPVRDTWYEPRHDGNSEPYIPHAPYPASYSPPRHSPVISMGSNPRPRLGRGASIYTNYASANPFQPTVVRSAWDRIRGRGRSQDITMDEVPVSYGPPSLSHYPTQNYQFARRSPLYRQRRSQSPQYHVRAHRQYASPQLQDEADVYSMSQEYPYRQVHRLRSRHGTVIPSNSPDHESPTPVIQTVIVDEISAEPIYLPIAPSSRSSSHHPSAHSTSLRHSNASIAYSLTSSAVADMASPYNGPSSPIPPVQSPSPSPPDLVLHAPMRPTAQAASPPSIYKSHHSYQNKPLWKPVATTADLILTFLIDTVPRQIYLYFLLGLPALYHGRVTRIFEDADMTMPELKRMALEMPMQTTVNAFLIPGRLEPRDVPEPYQNLKHSWETFIDSLLREWKTFNIISVLLLSAILTILQIDSAAADPVTRFSALLSLFCALVSLLCGCMYIIRFGSMRKTHKAAEWALEGQKSRTAIFWNVWVLLAMPLVWLAWSIILYILCIIYFVWRTGPNEDTPLLMSDHTTLGPRIAISGVLGLALVYFVFIFSTFRRYGDPMDQAWRARIQEWMYTKEDPLPYRPAVVPPPRVPVPPAPKPTFVQTFVQPLHSPSRSPSPPGDIARSPMPPPDGFIPFSTDSDIHLPPPHEINPDNDPQTPGKYSSVTTAQPPVIQTSETVTDIPNSLSTSKSSPTAQLPDPPASFDSVRVMDKQGIGHSREEVLLFTQRHEISSEDWKRFIEDVIHAWAHKVEQAKVELVHVLKKWNVEQFYSKGVEANLCREFRVSHPEVPIEAIYLVECPRESKAVVSKRFTRLPPWLKKIDVIDGVSSDEESQFWAERSQACTKPKKEVHINDVSRIYS